MNILIASTNFAPELTGTGRYNAEMASWLTARGHVVEAIVAPPHYPAWHIESEYQGWRFFTENWRDVRVHRAPLYVPKADNATALRRIAMETSFNISATRWWIPRLSARVKPDVIIAVCPPTQIVAWPRVMQLLRGIPTLLHVQDLQVDAATQLSMLSGNWVRSLLLVLERAALKGATHVSTISEPMRTRIVEKGVPQNRVTTLPNWASIPLGGNPVGAGAERLKLGIQPDETFVLYSGNLGKKQGLETLLDAASLLRKDKKIKIVVAGEGTEKLTLKNIARKLQLPNVLFQGLVAEERLSAALSAADIHLVLQRSEAADLVMPSKLTNILAAGKPSIVTAAAGTELARIIGNHDAGLVVPAGDGQVLASAISRLAHNREERIRMAANARSYASEHLDIDHILGRLERLLGSLGGQACKH